jgi:outer membrane protein assembly factor BamD
MKLLLSSKLLSVFIFIIILVGCKSSNIEPTISAEKRFEMGMQEFKDENYLEAINEFSVVTLQYPGSSVSDKAQYYLGESRFYREEYLLAAYEYEALKRNMPASTLVPKAQFRIAESYYNLAPESPLDQTYSLRAIDEFQTFVEYYPTDSLALKAAEKIKELRDRLAEKEYQTAVIYMKMEYYKAATLYFNNVLENYHDSKFAERAYVGKIESLVMRKKIDEARIEAEKLFSKFPSTIHRDEVENLLK